MKKISDWAKVLLPLVDSGMILHYLFLWHERRHAVAPHKKKSITNRTIKEENTMIAQCLYQSDPKNLASMGRQRLACQRAARKLQWGVQKERISETKEPVPLLMRPAVKEILQDAEQHRFDVLLIGNQDSLCCDAADMESFFDCAELVQHPHLCRRPGAAGSSRTAATTPPAPPAVAGG